MGMDCIRNIEVLTDDIKATIDNHNLAKYGKLAIGDIILTYNTKIRFHKIKDIDDRGYFVYEDIPEPQTIEDAVNGPQYNPVYRVDGLEELPLYNVKLYEGDIVNTWNGYYKYDGTNWNKIDNADVPRTWKPVSWYINGKQEYDVDTGMSNFVRNYIYTNWWGDDSDSPIASRGLPDDVTDIVKENSKDCFGYTYITLNELEPLIETEHEKFKNKMLEAYNKTGMHKLNEKIDMLLENANLIERKVESDDAAEDEYDEEYDSPSAIYDEYIYNVISIENELEKINTVVETTVGYISNSKIRVIYFLAN